MYNTQEALVDASLAANEDEAGNAAYDRLGAFARDVGADEIRENYLSLARLFWKLPTDISFDLVHSVTTKYLMEEQMWADVYLWSLSALRHVPNNDSLWVTRNTFATALKALGQAELATKLLEESLHSQQNGSRTAYMLLTGNDPDSNQPLDQEGNFFQNLSAPWLNPKEVDKLRLNLASHWNQTEAGGKEFVANSSKDGLPYYILNLLGEQMRNMGGIDTGSSRNNKLFAMTLAAFDALGVGSPRHLEAEVGSADEQLAELASMQSSEEAITKYFLLGIATAFQCQEAYAPAIYCLARINRKEVALGLARVAVWKNIPRSAEFAIQLMGWGNKVDVGGIVNPTQSDIFEAHRFVNEIAG
jgi:hypothetical protein